MDKSGVQQVPEGSRERRKMEETGCEATRGSPTTPVVKGLVKVKLPDQHCSSQVWWTLR